MTIYKFSKPLTVMDVVNRISRTAKIIGNGQRLIHGITSFENAQSDSICFCDSTDNDIITKIKSSEAEVIIIGKLSNELLNIYGKEKTFIIVENPMLYFIDCINILFEIKKKIEVSKDSFVHPEAEMGEGVLVEPTAIIDKKVSIGSSSEIHSGVRIFSGTKIGKQVVIRSNAIIGSEGLAYGQENDGSYVFLPHLGSVIIKNNVDIGSNTVIVKGILKNTTIEAGTKIGNLVNIGHNVSIGENCFISAGAILCGSVQVAANCWIAPGAKILNKVIIGEGAKIGLGSVVVKNVKAGEVVAGVPAKPLVKVS